FVPDVVGNLLDAVEPWKFGAVEEFDRRKIGEMVSQRLRIEAFLAPDHDVDGGAEAAQVLAAKRLEMLIEITIEERALFGVVLLQIGLRLGDGWAQLGPQVLH